MAKEMVFDDARALRREQREARISRKRERREARALKRRQHPIALEPLAPRVPAVREPSVGEAASPAEPVAIEISHAPVAIALPVVGAVTPEKREAAPEAAATDPVSNGEASPATPSRQAERRGRGRSRRERDVAEFRERRDRQVTEARVEAREQIARNGEAKAVSDALAALAHPEAFPWQRHRERLTEAIAGGRIPEIGAAARRACRGAAADAARTSHKAPDPETALAVACAYAVIARAPWAAVKGRRAERSSPTPSVHHRPFWR